MKPVEYNHAGKRLSITIDSQWKIFPFPNKPVLVQVENINEHTQTVELISIDRNCKTYMQSMTITFELWEKMHPVFLKLASF